MKKTKIVLKKGRYVRTKTGKEVIKIARSVSRALVPLVYRKEIVGSIRRKSSSPVDVDIVAIPRSKKKVIEYMRKKGRYLQGGDKKAAFKIKGVKVEIYFASVKSWGAHLITYTGPFQYSIGLRVLAKKKGYLFNQYGVFRNKKYIVGSTERSIYRLFGKKWKAPELRGI